MKTQLRCQNANGHPDITIVAIEASQKGKRGDIKKLQRRQSSPEHQQSNFQSFNYLLDL